MSKHFYFACIWILFGFMTFCRAEDQFVQRTQRYHLHPGDVLTVNYRYTPEYNATISIQPDGFADLPLLGELKIGELTLTEAHALLISKASERLNNPEVNLDLKEFEKPYYIVGGEVGNPGKFEIKGSITALRAIEIAGGFKTSGKSSQVWLVRPIDHITAQTKLIDMKRMMDRHEVSEDVELRAGDMLIVPKTRIAKVEPFIRLANPGSFGLYLNPLAF